MSHRNTPAASSLARRLAFSLLLGLAFPGTTAAQDDAGADEALDARPTTRFIARQRLALLLNPMGAEHRLELAGRTDIGDQSSLLFTGAHFEAGALSAISPIYATGGGYLQITPLSFLAFRAELEGEGIWPIGMDGAGYYGFCHYEPYIDDIEQAMPAANGRGATGWRATFSGTLQGMIPLGRARILFLDQIAGERAHVGDAPYFYDPRNDIVRGQTDWLLKNDVFLGFDLVVGEDTVFRAGVYDSLRYRPASSFAHNQLGPILMMVFNRPNKFLSSVTPFVRAGYYTHHGLRQGQPTVLGGISLNYDLGGY
jgi:hypothetical protein